MKGKRNRIRKLISILCMVLVFTLAVPCVAEAAPASWSVKVGDGEIKWYCTGRKGYFYDSENSVYHHVNGKDKKLTSWESYPSIVYGRGDWLYVEHGDLYGYNLKTGKKKIVIRDYRSPAQCNSGCGPYIYANVYSPTGDFSPFTVWKLSGGTAKKVRTVGNNVRLIYPLGKNVYFDELGSVNNIPTVTLYRCAPNGSGKKKLFSLQLKNGHIYPEGFTDTEYTVFLDDFDAQKSTLYSYNFKTGKLSVKSVQNF